MAARNRFTTLRGPDHRRRRLETLAALVWLLLAMAILGVAVGASILIGANQAHADTGDAAFVDTLVHYDVPMPGGASEAQRVGHVVCTDLAAGTTLGRVLAKVYVANPSYDAQDAAYFVGAAIGAYCPWQDTDAPAPTGNRPVLA